MAGSLMNNEMEKCWMEAVMEKLWYYPSIFLGVIKPKKTLKSVQDRQYPN
jgi:hypothetical protein